MANIFEPEFDARERDPGFTYERARLGRQAGAERLGASLYEIPPGQTPFPFHFQLANEEMLIVIAGRPSLRTPDGWRELEPGAVVAFPLGARGAHQVMNRSEEAVRVLMISEMNAPEVSLYPDSKKIAAAERAPGAGGEGRILFFRESDQAEYLAGEKPPETGDADTE